MQDSETNLNDVINKFTMNQQLTEENEFGKSLLDYKNKTIEVIQSLKNSKQNSKGHSRPDSKQSLSAEDHEINGRAEEALKRLDEER